MRLLTLLLLIMSTSISASSITFSRVVDVDASNTLYVQNGNQYDRFSLGYITTPVEGEPYFEETQKLLKEQVVGKWVRLTKLSYGKGAQIKPVLVRTKDLVLINKLLVEKGLALPALASNPPQPIVIAAREAKEKNVGLWNDLESFNDARNSEDKRIESILVNFNKSLLTMKSKGIEPYIGIISVGKAYKLACLKSMKGIKIFATKSAAVNAGYKVMSSCY